MKKKKKKIKAFSLSQLSSGAKMSRKKWEEERRDLQAGVERGGWGRIVS